MSEESPIIKFHIGEGINAMGNVSMLINPVTVIHTKYCPAVISFVAIVVISNFGNLKNSVSHSLYAKIYKENEPDKTVREFKNDKLGAFAGENLRFNWRLDKVDIKSEGKYIIECRFDGQEEKDFFYIKADEQLHPSEK